jgi:hypothetical protein
MARDIVKAFKQLLEQEKESPENIAILEEGSKIPDCITTHPLKPIEKPIKNNPKRP